MAESGTTLLAIDCAGGACIVALQRGAATLAGAVEPMRHGQAERLVPLIESVLADGGARAADLDAVGATTGPGGYTGVRIGLATARGYALGLEIPVVGATRFAVAAAAAGEQDRDILVALDTRRSDVALQHMTPHGRPRGAPWTAEVSDAAAGLAATPLAVAGDKAESMADALAAAGTPARIVPGTATPHPGVLGRVLLDAHAAGDAETPRPLYLGGAHVTPDPATASRTE